MPSPALSVVTPERLLVIEADRALPSAFAADVSEGLTRARKRLSFHYFYDAEGSALFEEICALPEYYVTRAELEILTTHADEIMASCPSRTIVELGSGSATKTRKLLEAALRRQRNVHFLPLDISRSILEESSRDLLTDYPRLDITAIAAEYRAGLRWLENHREAKTLLWLGSNVGNFSRTEAVRFLQKVRASLSPSDRLLMGVDLRKSRDVLEAAYDDAAGVTARFNLNLLVRINRDLGGRFDLTQFGHRARYNERLGRVEMHLVSKRAQTVRIERLGLDVTFRAGETIFTESSYKYSFDEIDSLARRAGFAVERRWLDRGRRFSANLLVPFSG